MGFSWGILRGNDISYKYCYSLVHSCADRVKLGFFKKVNFILKEDGKLEFESPVVSAVQSSSISNIYYHFGKPWLFLEKSRHLVWNRKIMDQIFDSKKVATQVVYRLKTLPMKEL